jgi:hypothetical protein
MESVPRRLPRGEVPMRLIRLTISGFLALALLAVPLVANAQGYEEVFPTGEIPRQSRWTGEYKSWSLFLVCNPEWLMPAKDQDLAGLYSWFKRFGDAIGRDNLAVWFWNRRAPLHDPKLAEYVDVARSAEFCRELKLRPSEGPFLVITSTYPSLESFPGERDRAVFPLGGRTPRDLAILLRGLTNDLLLTGKVDPGNYPVSSVRLWERLLEATQSNLTKFGCGVAPKIQVSVLSLELSGCPRGG